jgi:voltage-gated potassium channel
MIIDLPRRKAKRRTRPRTRQTQLPRILLRIYAAIGVLLGVIVLATAGFYFGSDSQPSASDALYMTLITITTVGFKEVFAVDTVGERLFVGILAIAGFGTITFLFTSLTVFFLESDLDYSFRRRRMEKRIMKLRDHYIICGFGRVGRNVAQELIDTDRQFVAIDSEESPLTAQQERIPGLLYLHGDASDDDLMHSANIEHAKGVFAVTGDDGRNLMIVITAKQLNPHVRVAARCHETRTIEKLRRAGADTVVSPDLTGGRRIASTMIRPHVVTFLDEMLRTEHRLRLEDIVVPDGFVPKPLSAVKLQNPDYLLLAVRTPDGWEFNPPPQFELCPGHKLVAMTTPLGRMRIEASLAADA